MRVYSIIFYTKEQDRLASFVKKYGAFVKNAGYKSHIVCIEGNSLIQETQYVSPAKSIIRTERYTVFRDIPELRKRISKMTNSLSDTIIVLDPFSIDVCGEGNSLRRLICEYPEIKFVIYDENPKNDLDKIKKLFIDNLFPFEETSYVESFINNYISKCDKVNICSNQFFQECLDYLQNAEKKENRDNFYQEILQCKINQGQLKPLYFFKDSWSSYETQPELKFNDYIKDIDIQLNKYIAKSKFVYELLSFPRRNDKTNIPIKQTNPIISLINGYDNLFDASNLRYAIKQWEYSNLNVNQRNFLSQQNSRRDNFAICVEEERGQNRYNSYCLYANGYRVLPITSSSELKYINDHAVKFKPDIIIRDYDLQFSDAPDKINKLAMRSIDAIRGFSQKNDDDRWNVFIYKSPFWNNLTKIKTLFISRGNPDIIDIKHPDVFESIYPNETYHLENDGKKLIIPGMTKPLNGIHQPFENTQAIKACYDGIYHKKWPLINTDRKNHSHGIPLDIYDLIQSLIERSEYYYSINKYVHSAILSNEAIEIMNGFHKSLMVKAYHLYAISENAVSMNAIGVDERELQEDAQIRISKIERTVRWFYRKKNNEGWEQSKNVLNQIYNDCRRFCKDKEHFLSEEAFVGAMGHSNDGINIFREISCLFKIINWHKNGTE